MRSASPRCAIEIHVERLALQPRVEPGSGEQIVEQHGQLEAIRGGKEGIEVEHPDLVDRGRLDLLDEPRQIQVPPLLPGRFQNLRDEDVLAAAKRIGIDAEQAEKAGRSGSNALA